MDDRQVLAGKRVVISGSSRGLGRAFAIAVADQGARVVVNGTNGAAVEEVLSTITASGGVAIGVVGSVADDSVCEQLILSCVESFGGIDVAMANAAVLRHELLLESTTEAFDEVIAVNLRGAWSLCRHATRAMKRSGGLLLLSSSPGAFIGMIGEAPYGASKAGMMGLLFNWDLELAEYGIRVNAIMPSADTDASRTLFEHWHRRQPNSDETPAIVSLGRAEEVAQLVVYLCSEAASHVRSQCMRFNGRRLAIWRHPAEAFVTERDRWTFDEPVALPLEQYPVAQVPRQARAGSSGAF